MSQPELSAAFLGSPMKRVKQYGLARSAAVELGDAGTADDVAALKTALAHDEPLMPEDAAWAVRELTSSEVPRDA